ncbi:MAG: hypothetical protein ABIM99_05755 [Candidatus Dojkabacteria bacterium]
MNPQNNGLNEEQQVLLQQMYNSSEAVKAFEGGNYLFFSGAIKAVLEQMVGVLPAGEQVHILDLGCGGGMGGVICCKLLEELNLIGDWTGIDIAEGMIANAALKLNNEESASIYTGNFRNPTEEMQENLFGKHNFIIAFGAGDGMKNYYAHMNDILKYAADGATILIIDYIKGSYNEVSLGDLVSQARPTNAHALGNGIAGQIARTPAELGITNTSMLSRAVRNPKASLAFIKLGGKESGFPAYTSGMNTLGIKSLLEFAIMADAEVASMSNKNLPYNPIILRFVATPKVKQKVVNQLNES